jgi:hypothetical protein
MADIATDRHTVETAGHLAVVAGMLATFGVNHLRLRAARS